MGAESEQTARPSREEELIGIATVCADGRLRSVDPGSVQLLGYSADDLLGMSVLDIAHADHRSELQRRLGELAEGHSGRFDLDARVLRKDGATAPVRFRARLLPDERGGPASLVLVVQELPACGRTPDELEALFLSASHDLRAPLRAIDGFARMLADDYGALLAEDGRRYLERIRGASRTLARIIEGVLIFSRAARSELIVSDVDLGLLAQRIVAELRQRQPARDVFFQVGADEGELLVVRGDEELIRRALECLLGNAWKFTSKRPDARVELGRHDRDGSTAFFVRDNGVGFDMSRADRLFSPFQRLHAKSEFEGSGIGLATVQRVVCRHGGRVWAQSTPGSGATFYFTLAP